MITSFFTDKRTADVCSIKFQEIINMLENNPEKIIEKEKKYYELRKNENYQQALNEANIWTSSFFWPFEGNASGEIPRYTTIEQLREKIADPELDNLMKRITNIAKENQFFLWYIEYPEVFSTLRNGFDCILTNPPWEVIRFFEMEFFIGLDNRILNAPNQSERRKLIKALKEGNSILFNSFKVAWQSINKQIHFFKNSDLFSLSSKGPLNTYALFTERCWSIIIEPVSIAGTTVQRASLANPNLIEELGLKIGSKVVVSKRGDIIPKIERVVQNPSNAKRVGFPTICNACNIPLIDEGTRLYCPNKDCPKRAYHRLTKWIKKLGVKNFGELILKQLFDSEKVRKISDLYELKVPDLTKLERVGEKSAQKALDNLFAVKEASLSKFIGGFDLENIGESLVEKIVIAGYNTLEKVRKATAHDLSRVELFGDITANQFYKEFHSLYSEMIEVLDTKKIKIRAIKMGSNKLEGLTFCFTGKLETMTRNEANALVSENGGVPKSGVVKDLSYLVTNSTEPTSKYVNAQGQGSKIISESEFLAMIND